MSSNDAMTQGERCDRLQSPVACVALCLFLLGGWEPSVAADSATGQQKSAVCAACHGVDGNSANPEWPKLAGQHAGYLVKQLQDYRSGARRNAQMSALVTTLNDADMADIAAYYAGQQLKHGQASAEWVELGERLYRAGNRTSGVPACTGCHGPTGRGNLPAAYPVLGGQYARYTADQLRAFKQGQRDNDGEAVMRTISSRMSEVEIEAVAEYISGLH